MKYCRAVIKRANKTEDENEDQKIRSRTGWVKLSSLSNTQASQSDTRLSRIMFHKIAAMYRNLKHQETLYASLAIQNLKSPVSFSPPHLYQPTQLSLPVKIHVVLPGLQDIQPLTLQVWNCDDIGFDLNGNWNNMVCTYKFFRGDRLWRTHTDERSPF